MVFMHKKNCFLESVLDLNSGNIWGVSAEEIMEMWENDLKDEDFCHSEEKVLNVMRQAFELNHYDKTDERENQKYKGEEYVILPSSKGENLAVAIRKKGIRQITDLSYENIKHVTATELLALIERNFGGGWDSISLSIRDIIETAFDISTTTLPASRIRAKGGTLERKVADGYEVLEIAKGTWVEAIFAKKREPLEKLRMLSDQEYDENGNRRVMENDDEDEDEDDMRRRRRDEDDEDEDNTNDETFYGSYTPEADVKDDEEELGEV